MKRLNFFLSLLFVAALLGSCNKNEQDKTGINAVENGNEEGKDEPATSVITGTEAGHDYVDLGLSVMWATCNIGAENPEDYGKYFACGDTVGYAKDKEHEFNWATYFDNPSGDGQNFTTYHNYEGGLTELTAEHDAATHNWGGKWRMPSKDELAELYDNDKIHSKWVTNYKSSGKNGRVFYKKKEGAATYDVNSDLHIFLPAAGCRYDGELNVEGNYGGCWSRSLNEYDSSRAWCLNFSSSYVGPSYGSYRNAGLSVRAVCLRAD